jgi:hypothetical protein
MKKLIVTTSLILAGISASEAAFTYLDASAGLSGNTTLANGSTFTPPLNGTTGTDNNWEQRTTFGSGGNIFEAGGEQFTENAPEIRTVISGLTPGATVAIYVNFWDPTSAVEDWNVRAGLASNVGANTLYTAADATIELGSTAAVLASTLTYGSGPSIFLEGGRDLLAGYLGTATADINGQIPVFIDDRNAATTVNLRTWYDGVSYEVIPEPATALLGAFGLLGLLRRRR